MLPFVDYCLLCATDTLQAAVWRSSVVPCPSDAAAARWEFHPRFQTRGLRSRSPVTRNEFWDIFVPCPHRRCERVSKISSPEFAQGVGRSPALVRATLLSYIHTKRDSTTAITTVYTGADQAIDMFRNMLGGRRGGLGFRPRHDRGGIHFIFPLVIGVASGKYVPLTKSNDVTGYEDTCHHE